MPADRLVECIPNFSEGRDAGLLREIAAAMQSVPGVYLLDEERDEDHHRSVLTLVGPPEGIVEAAVQAASLAQHRIDLSRHRGVHPRVGALDVLPFVPVRGVTLAECVELARLAAQRIWERCRIPCYFYEAAASLPERRNLETVRKHQFEELRALAVADPAFRPDVGGPELHPTAGATMVGARKFLIAWNVWLRTADLSVARRIAKTIRQSSGGFPFVKALGLPLQKRGLTQVSMNLTDFEETPPQPVFEAILAEAARQKVEVIGTELIGLVPRRALEVNFRESLRIMNFRQASVLENALDLVVEHQLASQAPTSRAKAVSQAADAPTGLSGPQLAIEAAKQLLQAVQLATSYAPSQAYGGDFPWAAELLECGSLLQRVEAIGQVDGAPEGESPEPSKQIEAQRLSEVLLLLADKNVSLQTRIAAERSRLREDAAESPAFGIASAIRHLLVAALHLTLLAADALMPQLAAPQAETFRNRIRPVRALTGQV
jgi:glutamate formiminotransferase